MSVRASNAAWLVPGCRLDRYDLLLQIAEGGMGLLWLARQQGKHGFDRIVAIKTILPKLASDLGFRQMFLDEARVVSRIEHPNVAQVLDLGEERGVLFLVMEWIDGESLIEVAHEIARKTGGQIPVGILARVMVDACAGLHAAHELTDDDGIPLGVVHRDVSPHNLLVGFRGTTKIIDFGIAKTRNRLAQDTSVGLLKGKIAYMAPEQAMGMAVDRRADVWSAGASMYRFLAGRVPYDAKEPVGMLRRISDGLPPARLSPIVPEPIRIVIEKALEPSPGKRFDTAHAMGIALEAAMRDAHVDTTRDDVAAFMAEHLGEAHATRSREIDDAARWSRARMRVELGRSESGSDPSLPNAGDELTTGGLPVGAEDRWEGSLGKSDVSGKSSRPSGRPTVVARASEPPIRPSQAATRGTEAASGAADLPVVPYSTRHRAPRSLVAWLTAACLFGVLASVIAWRATQRPYPLGVADAAPSPTAGEKSILPSVSTLTVQPTPPMPDLPASAAEVVYPNDPRASSTRPKEPSVADHSSSGDLLERARRARRAGRIGEAAALFAAAVEKAPADSEALTGLAEVDEAQGATAQAIFHYRRAVAVNPKYLQARLGLADALWTSGQRDEAKASYRSIVDQFPATMCPDLVRERAYGDAANEKLPSATHSVP